MLRSAAAVAIVGLVLPGVAHAYGWPVKPFDRMHAVRGTFDDPRLHVAVDLKTTETFHSGVDIAVPDGTPVYAVESGVVVLGPQAVSLRRPNRRDFGYWHVRPVVHTGEHVRRHQLLGYVIPGWGHVHFSETVAGRYRNPLRKGALTPYRDPNVPVVDAILVEPSDGHALQAAASSVVGGTVALVAGAYELPAIEPAAPWDRSRIPPAFVRWRLIPADGSPPTEWLTAADFRFALEPSSAFADIYAPGTYQNKPNRPGSYRFWLAQSLDTASMPNGEYSVEVEAGNLAGLDGYGMAEVTIANGEAG